MLRHSDNVLGHIVTKYTQIAYTFLMVNYVVAKYIALEICYANSDLFHS